MKKLKHLGNKVLFSFKKIYRLSTAVNKSQPNNMDGDSKKREKSNQKESSNCCLGDSDLSEPPRVRRSFLYCDAVDKFLLDDVWNILPRISIIFWLILLFAS